MTTNFGKLPVDPENRLLARVSVDDAAEADKIFDMLMGIRLNLAANLSKKMPFTVLWISNILLEKGAMLG